MIRIGILGAADIAKRRFLPALGNSKECEFIGVAAATDEERACLKTLSGTGDNSSDSGRDDNSNNSRDNNGNADRLKKAAALTEEFGGKVFESYEDLINSDEIDAVYIPLPPSLHYYWGKKALYAGKHVYMEKPFTTELANTQELVNLAKVKGLALFENYGFTFNDQMKLIDALRGNDIGQLRLIRGYFGFPKRPDNDFRHVKALGGGALLDCGGYTLKAARFFLGDSMRIISSNVQMLPHHDVDGWGTVTAVNDDGLTAQLAFGMDNQYKCELEVWGSIGTIQAPRIYTPPAAFTPEISLTTKDGTSHFKARPEDAFLHGIDKFAACVLNKESLKGGNEREAEYREIMLQGRLVDEAMAMAGLKDGKP